ncbi:MAG: DUF2075 domain-containing protein [Dorea sp.]|nr:DUF2075 domain-containing protein [Dorea sp.]
MVTFIPPYCGEEIKSNAEKKMYKRLQRLDMENAYVLHSLGLPKHESKIYGEIDFVVVCDRGVACLEIKGGRVECRNGRWYFIDRYGVSRQKPEGPFAQVTGNMFSLRGVLKRQFKGKQYMNRILVASGVVFPDIRFESHSQEIIPEIIYDKNTTDITTYINCIFNYWEERQHKEPCRLSDEDITEVVSYLRGNFVFIPTLNDRLADVEKRLVRLTFEQVQIMDALSMNERLMIEGNAGTGKTMLAVHFAKTQAENGKRVLYLTFNKNLAYNVQHQLGNRENLRIINIHALFGNYVQIDVEHLNENPQQYFSVELPKAFCEYVSSLEAETLERMQYDLLIMDEGQDILTPIYLQALDLLLVGGLENGSWAIFYDEKQNIYNPYFQEGFSKLQLYTAAKFRLFVNCRNTIQIGDCSSKLSGIKLYEYIHENGEKVQQIQYDDQNDFAEKVEKIIQDLREEKVNLSDVAFLAPKQYKKSMLKDVKIEVSELNAEIEIDKDIPIYATIQGFKGLDSKIVILFDVDHIREESFSSIMYIATTRARTLLYIFGSKEFWEKHAIRSTSF